MKGKVTKLEDNIFMVEYEEAKEAKEITSLSKFIYHGIRYRIKKIHLVIEIPMYFSYLVITK